MMENKVITSLATFIELGKEDEGMWDELKWYLHDIKIDNVSHGLMEYYFDEVYEDSPSWHIALECKTGKHYPSGSFDPEAEYLVLKDGNLISVDNVHDLALFYSEQINEEAFFKWVIKNVFLEVLTDSALVYMYLILGDGSDELNDELWFRAVNTCNGTRLRNQVALSMLTNKVKRGE